MPQGVIKSFAMAVHAGLLNGPFHIFCGMKRGLALLGLPVTGDAVDIRRKHEAGGIRNPNPSNPAVHLLRSHVDLLGVALIAIGGGMGKTGDLPNLMAKGGMATRAFDFVIGHVILVHELRGIFSA